MSMELGPIFRSLIHNKSRFWLIAMEIALTLAIVVNCVNFILDMRAQMTRPSGMDEEAILVLTTLPIIPDFKDDDYLDNSREEDLRMMRAQPGVVAATVISQIPLSGSGDSTGRKATGSEMDTLSAPYYMVGSDAVKTLGVEIIQGRNLVESDWIHEEEEDGQEETGEQQLPNVNVLVTKALANRLYPDGDALGRTITGRSGSHHETIVGIIGVMLNSWPSSGSHDRVMLYPAMPGTARYMRYLVRAEPGMVERL
jgi:putative ABC transport system permease protein